MDNLQKNLSPTNLCEAHIPCIILVDCSGGMSGQPITQVNLGFKQIRSYLQNDPLLQGRIEICVISFGDKVKTELGFRSGMDYKVPTLTAGGLCSFNAAVNYALDTIDQRKQLYCEWGIFWYRPWIFVLSKGYPTDDYFGDATRSRIDDYVKNKKVHFVSLSVSKDITPILESYFPHGSVLEFENGSISDIFPWLMASLNAPQYAHITDGVYQYPPLPNGFNSTVSPKDNLSFTKRLG